jgi:hypothetical protein
VWHLVFASRDSARLIPRQKISFNRSESNFPHLSNIDVVLFIAGRAGIH